MPYALSLRPGAQIERTESGIALEVRNTATGSALLSGSIDGYGLYGYSEDAYAVYGVDGGATQGKGYGGFLPATRGSAFTATAASAASQPTHIRPASTAAAQMG